MQCVQLQRFFPSPLSPDSPLGARNSDMPDKGKTRDQLLTELHTLRERVDQLETEAAEHKLLEQAVRVREQEYRTLLDNFPDLIVRYDTECRRIYVNPAWKKASGLSADEVLNVNAFDIPKASKLIVPEYMEKLRQVLQDGTPRSIEFDWENAHGEMLSLEYLIVPEYDRYGKIGSALAVGRDITGRKRAEEELRKSHKELELRVQDWTSQISRVNQELKMEIEERKRATEAIQSERQRFFDVLETLPVYVCLLSPDYHVPFANRVFRERFGESEGLRCFEHLFGRSEPCEICDTYTVLKTMAPHEWEWVGPDGRDYSIFDFPFRDIDGSVLILEMGIDITERKQAEAALNATVVRLEQSNQALQDFTSIASHDMKEPLRKVLSFGNMLRQKYKEMLGEKGNDYLDRMIDAASRMQTLLTSLLEYSRVTMNQEPFQEIDLYDLIHGVLSDLEVRIMRTGADIQVKNLPIIKADPVQMQQLFQNIIGNSLKFHKNGERPVVKIHCIPSDDVSCRIAVEDNGIGIDEQYFDKIFAPFQRLHGKSSPYQGTGMGLAICKKIVERHGGSITVTSTPGVGSSFIITLPSKREDQEKDFGVLTSCIVGFILASVRGLI